MSENAKGQKNREKDALVESEWVYRGKIVKLRKDLLKFNEKDTHIWDIIVHPGAVVLIPITATGELILVRQWRRAAKEILVELPAGTLEEGESPFDCAQRELQEETGFKAGTLIPFGGLYSAPGFCTEYLHFFIAKDLKESVLPKDETEGIDLYRVSINKALEMIDSHEINDAKTVAGILKYHRLQW